MGGASLQAKLRREERRGPGVKHTQSACAWGRSIPTPELYDNFSYTKITPCGLRFGLGGGAAHTSSVKNM